MYQHAINELQLAQDKAEAYAKVDRREGRVSDAEFAKQKAANLEAAIALLKSVSE